LSEIRSNTKPKTNKMNDQTLQLMKTVLQQTAGVQKLTTQQKDAAKLAEDTMTELEALQVELEKNTNDLITLLTQ
jgi:hypothetical protein